VSCGDAVELSKVFELLEGDFFDSEEVEDAIEEDGAVSGT
jgi:hypothetical protein